MLLVPGKLAPLSYASSTFGRNEVLRQFGTIGAIQDELPV